MCTAECKQALNNTVENIIQYFLDKEESQCQKIVSCLYYCCKEEFVKWAAITYRKKYPGKFIASVSEMAFTDAIVIFSEKAAAGKIYQDKASIRTILFGFFRFQLLYHIQQEKRLSQKKDRYAIENIEGVKDTDEEKKEMELLYKMLEKALGEMEANQRRAILLRHIEGKKYDEIAAILAINTNSAINHIYRCMKNLRNLVHSNNKKP